MTADITKASSLEVYTNSGAVNTALIDSDILKTLYNNPSSKARLTPFLGVKNR